ncbi:hypothetical protein FRB99_003648 [Tulasnella sp. 403]|nr:hypothetical protein FRB99_003648 [Tulasnella sp. 403]
MAPSALERKIQAVLDSRASRSILRRVDQPPPVGRNLVDFSSNDYLSLSTHPTLRSLFLRKLSTADLVLGSGGSRLLDGNTFAHYALETRLKEFFGAPSALLFNSGYDANVAIFTTLPQPGDVIIVDELIHASVWDGCRASRASENLRTFRHNDVKSLEDRINSFLAVREDIRLARSSVFVAVETLYSMDGDFAPLQAIVGIVERLLPLGNGHIVVDEAHATGLYGPQGKGLVAKLGLESRVTFSQNLLTKVIRLAVVLTNPLIRNYLVNYARSLIFTTALCHSNVVSIDCSFDMLQNGEAQKVVWFVDGLTADN